MTLSTVGLGIWIAMAAAWVLIAVGLGLLSLLVALPLIVWLIRR